MDEETLKQVARSAEQVAKTGEIALESLRDVGAFLYRLVGESLVELGQAGTDRIKAWRTRNLITIAAETRRELETRGLLTDFRSLPPGDSIRWIEGAAQEDEAEIQSLWARLLANAADSSVAVSIDKTIAGLLRELRPLDARVLQYLESQGWNVFPDVSGGFNVKRLAQQLQVSEEDCWLSIANLWRLGCLLQQVASMRALDGASIRTVGPAHDDLTTFRVSPLGSALLKAVRKPKT
jgi:hypothetical protein